MCVGVGGVFLAQRLSENRAGDRVREAVANASRLKLNGQEVQDPAILFATLRLVDHVHAHHSHPTTPIRIELLSDASSTTVSIARDSERPTEFWVFLPVPGIPETAPLVEAGRITSTDLNEFLRMRGL